MSTAATRVEMNDYITHERAGMVVRDRTAVDLALLAVRVIAGVIMAGHGAQKMFGMWGGPGLEMIMSSKGPGGGGIVGLLVAVGEFFGDLA